MSLPSSVPPALPSGFDPTGFVGEVAADGQRVRVAAIATDDDGRVVLLSLVGYETSVSAALARLMKGEQIGFLPTMHHTWDAPTALQALRVSYWLWRAEITGTREKQGVAFPRCASIDHCLRTPPSLPVLSPEATQRQQELLAANPFAETNAILDRLQHGEPDPSPMQPRFVFAPLATLAPTTAAFFGHLKGLRVITLPRPDWVDYLWTTGLHYGLIAPLPALGISVWRIDGNPQHWNAVVSEGVQRRMLTA